MKPEHLSPKVRRLIEDTKTGVVMGTARVREIATKFRLGKLPSARLAVTQYQDTVIRLRARTFPISSAHALLAGSYLQAHRDPLSRLLAAQAEREGLTLVSKDRALRQFGAKLLW